MSNNNLGYMVLLRENGKWTDDWDATVHPDKTAGESALSEAQAAGYEVCLVELVLTELDAALRGQLATPDERLREQMQAIDAAHYKGLEVDGWPAGW